LGGGGVFWGDEKKIFVIILKKLSPAGLHPGAVKMPLMQF